MLWVDKHRPTSLDKLDFHVDLSKRLASLADSGDIPHMLFSGPSGAGKKTRVMALLRALFGAGVERMRIEHKSFKTPSRRTVEVMTVASNYHIEMNPSDAGIYDRYVVQEVIKQIASATPLAEIDASGKASVAVTSLVGASKLAASSSSSSSAAMEDDGDDAAASGAGESKTEEAAGGGGGAAPEASTTASGRARRKPRPKFKVVVLTEVDGLSRDAQAALRRTMEVYMRTTRLVLCCETPSRVIAPLRSRCLTVRVPAPSQMDVMNVLGAVAKKEKLDLPKALAARVARAADRNVRRAVLMLEACRVQQYPFTPTQLIQTMDWERYIQAMARDIEADQSPAQLLRVRKRIYDLFVACIPSDVVMKTLVKELLNPPAGSGGISVPLQHQLVMWAAHCEHKMQMGSKEVIHIEAFVAKAMHLIKFAKIEQYKQAAAGGGGGK